MRFAFVKTEEGFDMFHAVAHAITTYGLEQYYHLEEDCLVTCS